MSSLVSSQGAAAVAESAAIASAQLLLRGELESVTISSQDGITVSFDAVLSESHDDLVEVTQLPVESGAPVSDHLRAQPTIVSVTGILSDTPIAYAGGLFGDYPDADTRYRKLFQMMSAGKTVALSTPRRKYQSVAISALSATVQSSTGDAIEIALTLQEVRIVDAEVTKQKRQKSVSTEPTDIGKHVTEPPAAATAATVGSILHKLGASALNAMRGVFGGG